MHQNTFGISDHLPLLICFVTVIWNQQQTIEPFWWKFSDQRCCDIFLGISFWRKNLPRRLVNNIIWVHFVHYIMLRRLTMRSSVSMSSLGTQAVLYIKAFRRYTSFLSSPDIVYLLLLYTTKSTKSTSPGCWPTNKAVFRRSTRIRHAILNIIIIIHNSNISFRFPKKCRYILKNCLNSILFLWFIPYQRTWCVTGGLLALLIFIMCDQCLSWPFYHDQSQFHFWFRLPTPTQNNNTKRVNGGSFPKLILSKLLSHCSTLDAKQQ